MGRADRGGEADRLAWASGLEPAVVWREFAGLSAIPRRSKHEEAVRRHVIGRLAEVGITATVDDAGNVLADVPASPGAEGAAQVVLQAHLDMVCEADAGTGMDPAADGVFPAVAGGWVQARGTTLGADDGIGVAVALAVATDAALATPGRDVAPRPPLQLLFTVDEEEDFGGAAGVEPRHVPGRVLLNLDSEREDEVIIGSAGGSRVIVRIPGEWEPSPDGLTCVDLRVHGLDGGHSGGQIDQNLMNAIKALAYTLGPDSHALEPGSGLRVHVAGIEGGRADNAIPREARATLLVDADARDAIALSAARVQELVRQWRAGADDNAIVELVDLPATRPRRVLSGGAAGRLIDLLLALPSGVVGMDEAVSGVVRTSTNLGVLRVEGDDVVIVCAPRSSRQADLDALHARFRSFARLAGAQVTVTSEYPAWEPEFESTLLTVVREAYGEVHGRDPHVTAVHAGLEVGEIAAHLPGLVAVSIGPTVVGAHSPGERLEVASVGRFYELVRAILRRLAVADPG